MRRPSAAVLILYPPLALCTQDPSDATLTSNSLRQRKSHRNLRAESAIQH